MKRNDIIFFNDELFVVIKEVHVNAINDPAPHKGIEVRKPLNRKTVRVILEDEYELITTLAIR